MRCKILTLLFIVFSLNLFAQTPEWQWAIQGGGIDDDVGMSIVTDNNGNCYVTGSFKETATFGSIYLHSNGTNDVFVAKINSEGNWIWAVKAGGAYSDWGYEIDVDEYGNCYIIGNFGRVATFGSIVLNGNNHDIFVAKIDTNGNWLWAVNAGGATNFQENGYSLAIDDECNIYFTGYFYGEGMFGPYVISSQGAADIFVAKLDTNGIWQWVNCAGSNAMDGGLGIQINSSGTPDVVGYFQYTATFGPYSLTSNGHSDIFFAELDSNGSWQSVSRIGDQYNEVAIDFKIDENGNKYITGYFENSTIIGSHTLYGYGNYDIFVAKMDSAGNWLWATSAGGVSEDWGCSIAFDNYGNTFVTGHFSGESSFGSITLNCINWREAFISKIDTQGYWQWVMQTNGTYSASGRGITLDNTNNIFVAGSFAGEASFGNTLLDSGNSEKEIFVTLLNNAVSVEHNSFYMPSFICNFPNPFNPSTTIEFSINSNCNIELSIFNIKGQKIKTLAQNEFSKGSHSVVWNGDDKLGESVSSGIYLYNLKVNGKTEAVKKCLLLK